MGLLDRIKSKSEKIIGEKSSTKIKDDITSLLTLIGKAAVESGLIKDIQLDNLISD